MRQQPVIEVKDLTVDFLERSTWNNVVNRVSFAIHTEETLGLAGESGCGKSTTAYALIGYRRTGSRFREGTVVFDGQDMLRIPARKLRALRGHRIAIIPQNPATTLTPSMRIEEQITETIHTHQCSVGNQRAKVRAIELLEQVGLSNPSLLAHRYPHQLSGGQQQRVVAAMALACNPTLLVLDEPTTALDVTTQAVFINLLLRLKREHGMSMLYVTHDLAVLAQISDRIAIMYAGELIERAPTAAIYAQPCHPYTRGLIAAVPRISTQPEQHRHLRGLLQRASLPAGCRFAPRCDYAQPRCYDKPQTLLAVDEHEQHHVACWLWETIAEQV